PLKGAEFRSSPGVPQQRGSVRVSHHNPLAVRAKRRRLDAIMLPLGPEVLEGANFLSGLDVPQRVAREDLLTVRTEYHVVSPDGKRRREGTELLAAPRVPKHCLPFLGDR